MKIADTRICGGLTPEEFINVTLNILKHVHNNILINDSEFNNRKKLLNSFFIQFVKKTYQFIKWETESSKRHLRYLQDVIEAKVDYKRINIKPVALTASKFNVLSFTLKTLIADFLEDIQIFSFTPLIDAALREHFTLEQEDLFMRKARMAYGLAY